VTETKLTLEPAGVWQPAILGREQFKTTNIYLTGADVRPRLDAILENNELDQARDIEIVATLFNDLGKPVTASQTFVDVLEGRSSKEIVFTWPSSIAKTVRSCIIPSDVVLGIDLSGSMNNDGGTPPEPITSALKAAETFVSQFNKNDQVAVVTFASEAVTAVPLNRNHAETAALISKLTIAPQEETGYTNTPYALKVAASELSSERHNGDARRVIVFLTDGLPTAKGDTTQIVAEAKSVAADVSKLGVEVYAIGLGKNVDFEFISSIATSEDTAFIAPTPADLANIYETITSSLCESSGATRIDVIAKTPTNFTPLR
jgi:Mg-chelatase subunit ChlD